MGNINIDICSSASVLLGNTAIVSLDDGSTEAIVAVQFYENTYKAMLTDTRWHFATRVTDLMRLAEKPLNRYLYKFRLPTDYLALVKCSTRDFEIYGRDLYCNDLEVQLEHIFTPLEENLPSYFIKALEYNLAAQFAIPLTDNTSRAELFFNMYQIQLKKARFTDASSRPNNSIDDSPYISVRY